MTPLIRARTALARGRLECFGAPAGAPVLAELAGRIAARPAGPAAHAIEFLGHAAWFKGSDLRGRASWRHAGRRVLGLPLPRVREHANLAWLGERLFHVPRPLISGAVWYRGRPTYQFLITQRLEQVEPLDVALATATPELRAQWIDELAREVARMHALHFVHHDLFVRNVLVRSARPPGGDQRRLVFIDAWRGGPGYLPRGPAYDLACLMLEGAALFTSAEQAQLLGTYLDERAVQGRAPRREQLLSAIVYRRAALMVRIAREPGRWRSAAEPVVDWQPPQI